MRVPLVFLLGALAAGAGHAAALHATPAGPKAKPVSVVGVKPAPRRPVKQAPSVAIRAAADSAVRRSQAVSMLPNHPAAPAPHVAVHTATAVSRRASIPSGIGGPARYDAKHGAVIGGAVMTHRVK